MFGFLNLVSQRKKQEKQQLLRERMKGVVARDSMMQRFRPEPELPVTPPPAVPETLPPPRSAQKVAPRPTSPSATEPAADAEPDPIHELPPGFRDELRRLRKMMDLE
ncbi:hypothetical protein [Rhodocyclus purpureus]|uniref:hypothetical protein n=1 Tax=Rhodocyclus purpureus TaxID=1067 RepID=UPI0019117D20|nr:hypothetical protein [Rhodocyclus purpureus]MBK5914634.1 hypothetical protein [Rhodocyclus purpureus]